jgi:glycine cleavage system H protein
MDALWNVVTNAAILMAGLAVRFAVALALLAVLVAVLLPFLYAGEGVQRLWRRLEGYASVAGLTWRRRTYYSPLHTWLHARGSRVRVGLDDLAGRLLRRIDDVTLPIEGTYLKEGDALFTMSSGTYLKEGDALLTMTSGLRGVVVPAPVEGIVTRVNSDLLDRPQAVIADPYRRGWLIEMQPATADYRRLRHDDEARAWMAAEAHRLSIALERATGIVAADGGELAIPSHLLLGEKQFGELAREFLGARLAVVTAGPVAS